ncbi:DUF815 domain-containing protein [Butyrivibrio sp. INlla16]|uniref:DUF815 domain-containing protein n=1 Tax=Butyrivibrio sp. INlla16 TaxID=1520807 RepID=UPI0008848D32|nr:DUF815 domain-containing protein [Butyrivibrio sp. INlla16]SDB42691.1 hypothetical protein SAMN02910263_02066 [Butyrivibrio sp. INlla16]
MDLNELRSDIDQIDSQLIALFEKRMTVSEKIADYKIQAKKSIFDKNRENLKLENVKSLVGSDENREPTGELFEKIMEISRKRQYERLSANGVTDENAETDPAYRELNSNNNSLILFRNATDQQTYLRDNLVILSDKKLADAHFSKEEQEELIHSMMSILIEESARRGFYGNLWHTFLALLLVSDENAYSMADEMRGDMGGTIKELALHDLSCFKKWFDIDFSDMTERLHVPEFNSLFTYEVGNAESKVFNTRVRDRICELAVDLARCSNAEEMLKELTLFYKHYGVGKFGLHKAFRVRHEDAGAVIEPIRNIRHVELKDLVGYEIAKQKLIDNTEAFVSGKKANNCLLYGDAGTGKSSSIKAIANEYYDRGLRIIEIYKHQFKDLNDVIAQIKGRNYKFIIYMDDLSFEEFETDYKYLKAVIEGGLEKKPENVLIYATSNRRHLIRESFKDKPAVLDDDLHRNDTVQEKLSLANRFGVTIYFGAPEMKEYDEIVRVLADRNGINMPEAELIAEARKWEMNHGGLSGRTAQQFIDYLLGK